MQTPSARGARRRDDRGFTLVELIVAIVILAIVFVPLLSAFVTGARTQAKSSQKNAATLAAQNIIEQIQADSIEAFRSKLSGDASPYSCSYSDASATGYTATVTATPVQQLSNDAKTPVNSQKVAVSNRMDAWVDMSGTNDTVLEEFKSMTADGDVTETELQQALHRNITIESKPSADGKNYNVTVTFNYYGTIQYSVPNYDKDGKLTGYRLETVSIGNNPSSNSDTNPVYAPTDTETITIPDFEKLATLKSEKKASYSLYISFKPITQSSKYYYNDDFTIINENGDGLDFNVFLINVLADGTSTVNYSPRIVYLGQQDKSCARVFSNIPLRVGSEEYRAYSGTSQPPVGMPKTISIDGTLVEKKAVDRMYNIEVKVYSKNDSTKPVVTMSAIKLG